MMKNSVDFLVSYLRFNGISYDVPNILGLGQIVCDNHAFTISMIKMALKHVIEACYVLGYIPNTEWSRVLLKLNIPIYTSGDNNDVIKYFENYDDTTNVDVLDNFIILLPYYSTYYFNDYSTRNNSAIQRNINFYSTRIDSNFDSNVLNNMLLMASYGVLSQTDTDNMLNFVTYMTKLFDENVLGYWGVMNTANNPKQGNDVSLSAMYIFIILTCICGLKIRGSTAPSNTKLEEYGIVESLWKYMPSTWASIKVGSVGVNKNFIQVSNQLPYIGG
jgi:hypothetical protein